jgi:hypothetical protein
MVHLHYWLYLSLEWPYTDIWCKATQVWQVY